MKHPCTSTSGRPWLVMLGLVGALGLSACADEAGGGDGAFSGEALASAEGAWVVMELRTGPQQPPVRGTIELELRLADADGAPLPGMTLAVTPWMPAMEHGSHRQPEVTDMGAGTYHVTNVGCPMAGLWQIDVDVTAPDGGSDHLSVPLQVR